MMKEIDIVMATYNGERFVKEQIMSILKANSYNSLVKDFIVSDDNSTDDTVIIISDICHDIRIIENKGSGVVSNFYNALINSTSPYIILSDQDDIWHESKIEQLYSGMKNIENDTNIPCVFFSDLVLIDETGKSLNSTFWSEHNINIHDSIHSLDILFRNYVPGCSMIINRTLLNMALPYLTAMPMHDWYFMNLAKFFGTVGFSENNLTYYRQHDSNVVGLNKVSLVDKIKKYFNIFFH
ncbi:glycosyltransferase, partial [Vibrio sp.]|nr:glycosyltransferase [Vibrio sp.]